MLLILRMVERGKTLAAGVSISWTEKRLNLGAR